jgi:hypothetical protein
VVGQEKRSLEVKVCDPELFKLPTFNKEFSAGSRSISGFRKCVELNY